MSASLSNGLASPEPAVDEESAVLHEPLLAQYQQTLRLRRSQSNTTSQVAIVGSNVCPIESLDYEIIENDIFKPDWRSMGTIELYQYTFMKWILCFLIGLIVGLLGFFINLAVENIAGVKFVITSNMMLARKWRSSLLWRSFFTTAVVAIVLRALIDVCLRGECGLFGKGGLIMYDVTSANISYHLRDVPPVLLLAVLGGIVGSLYNLLLNKVLQIYNLINKKGTSFRIILACSISIFTSCLLFGLPWTASCRACPSDASEPCPTIGRSGNYKKFQCPPGFYNDLASLFFNTNDDAIKNLFSKNTDAEFHHSSMLIFFATCFFLSIFSYGIVAPTGIFVPVIVTGAAYGRFIGMLVGSNSNLNHGLFAVLGSASLLGGSMRMTVSLCVIILELTNNLLLLPLIMIVLLISKTVADAFNGNIYDLIMALKGLPYLEAHTEPYMRQLTVGDVVTGPLQIFHGFEKVSNVVHVLKTTRHNGFPVIDEPPHSVSPVLFGLILRAHLLTLLKSKAFLQTPTQDGRDAIVQFSVEDFAKKGLGHGDKIEDIELSEEEMELYIDLHPFTNTSPYTVVETMSLAKALILFRNVGLRHLLVIPKVSGRVPVVGILSRHDFMPQHILNLHPIFVESRWKKLRFRLPQLSKLV
ncbi:hypothetical protein DH2020_030746 [Rehmannia glutinosa]|uniref:Chloride channel protein n=1 Tax=Rehmannia glutinosa TaxID=99300 RepID=A0ABR0VJX1_REHGL